MTTNLRELCERAAKVFGSPQNHTSDQIASMVDELEAAGRGEDCGGDAALAKAVIEPVREVLQMAYNSAEPGCCGHGTIHGCCGEPEPTWSEFEEQIMSLLGPAEKQLSEVIAATSTPTQGADQ